jgi:glycerol-3-phosphate dehydrogenase subunit C
MAESGRVYATSECPLAGIHIRQGMQRVSAEKPLPEMVMHPILLIARAYGIAI